MTARYDVVIVGGGPVGLAVARELSMRGHTSCIIEKNDRVGLQPRAKTTNVRTMTHMRRWGLAATMRERSPLAADFPRRVRFATALFGKELFDFENAFCAAPVRDERFPEHAEFIPQYVVEGILHEAALADPNVTALMRHELKDFQDDGDRVTAAVENLADGSRLEIAGRFLVGADGAGSTVRRRLGIEMEGERGLISFLTLILSIPGLDDDPDLHRALFHWLVSPDAACVLGPMDKGNRWYWARPIPADSKPDDATLLALVSSAIRKDYPVEILARDYWTVHRLLAGRYRSGNVFLAGDACHLHSPFGGHGMNLGVCDAVDLGWKLSAVLEGWADDRLLDSYEPERKPVHRQVLDTSTENAGALAEYFLAPALDDDTPEGEAQRGNAAIAIEEIKGPEFRSLGIVLGYRYGSPNIAAAESDPPPPFSVTDYRPNSCPGSLAPHIWLDDDTSLYDRFGAGFALLKADAGGPDAAEAAFLSDAASAGVPVKVLTLADARLAALYPRRYTLIRPDQHVAWRGDALPGFEALFATVLTGREKQVESNAVQAAAMEEKQ